MVLHNQWKRHGHAETTEERGGCSEMSEEAQKQGIVDTNELQTITLTEL